MIKIVGHSNPNITIELGNVSFVKFPNPVPGQILSLTSVWSGSVWTSLMEEIEVKGKEEER